MQDRSSMLVDALLIEPVARSVRLAHGQTCCVIMVVSTDAVTNFLVRMAKHVQLDCSSHVLYLVNRTSHFSSETILSLVGTPFCVTVLPFPLL